MPGADLPAPAWQAGSWYETLQGLPTDDEFAALYGSPLQDDPPLEPGRFSMEDSIMEMKDFSPLMMQAFRGTEATHCAGIWRESGLQQPGFPHDDYVRRRRAASCSGALQRRQLPGRCGTGTAGRRQRPDGWAGVIGQPSPSARARQGQLLGL